MGTSEGKDNRTGIERDRKRQNPDIQYDDRIDNKKANCEGR